MTCPSCHSVKAEHWITCRDRLRNKPLDKTNYYRCLGCGLTYLYPQSSPQHYDEHYDTNYISHATPRPTTPTQTRVSRFLLRERERVWENPSSLRSHLFRRTKFFRCAPLKYPGNGKRLLDVGSGAGGFLLTQQHVGWNVSGLEASKRMVEQSRSLGLDVHQGFSILDQWQDPTFDVVVLNQVFEHVTNPKRLLQEIQQVLKQDGILYMNMPNPRSLPARLFRSFWFNLDTPRHNLLFSPATLKKLLEQEDFKVLDLFTASSTKGWSGSIAYLMRDTLHAKLPSEKIRKSYWINKLFKPLVSIADLLRWGDNLHVIAQKKRL